MWLHLVEDKEPEHHDVWPTEIRVKLRGRDKQALIRRIRLNKRLREVVRPEEIRRGVGNPAV